ncbi:hypothetical protein IE53DRAFT_385764 [Violaceomyces palustris]|uniref:Uncharacterized protein n=1 Tax=Violaceomyces palustris TaxID=1673888 RepID=A0ACD0P1J2_9BASI|nr:hypothetical protein IE53DRAFT_385764 [Violaceomyces palustris]
MSNGDGAEPSSLTIVEDATENGGSDPMLSTKPSLKAEAQRDDKNSRNTSSTPTSSGRSLLDPSSVMEEDLNSIERSESRSSLTCRDQEAHQVLLRVGRGEHDSSTNGHSEEDVHANKRGGASHPLNDIRPVGALKSMIRHVEAFFSVKITKSDTARDFLARERNFFTWLRLSTLLAVLSGALFLQIRLPPTEAESTPEGGGKELEKPPILFAKRRNEPTLVRLRNIKKSEGRERRQTYGEEPRLTMSSADVTETMGIAEEPEYFETSNTPQIESRGWTDSLQLHPIRDATLHAYSTIRSPPVDPHGQVVQLPQLPDDDVPVILPTSTLVLGSLFLFLSIVSIFTGLVDYLHCQRELENEVLEIDDTLPQPGLSSSHSTNSGSRGGAARSRRRGIGLAGKFGKFVRPEKDGGSSNLVHYVTMAVGLSIAGTAVWLIVEGVENG